MDVPSPVDGVVKEIKVKVGDKVSEGALILVAEAEAAPAGVFASLKIAEGLNLRQEQEAVLVTILCDSGEKYLSERFWTEG
jgi:pyruvate/2-oxoglutarate dehydrogenase complex dihydrolipoamide acyltransferase (E2) component